MKFQGLSRAGWSFLGLALGGLGGFYFGRGALPWELRTGQERAGLLAVNGPNGMGKGGPMAQSVMARDGAGRKVGFALGESVVQTLHNILAIPDIVDRLAALREWCRTLPPEQVMTVMKEFQGMMEGQEQLGGVEATSLFFQSIEVIAQVVSERGAADMLAYFLAPEGVHEDAEMRHGVGGEVFKQWAERDPAAARAMLEARLASGEKIGELESELSKHLMRSWIKKEPEAAMAWLLMQPKELSEGAVSSAFQALSKMDPEKARMMVEAQADLLGRDEIAASLAQGWAKTSPDAAMEWAKGLPEKLSGNSVKSVMKRWAEQDFPAAKQALEGMSAALRQAALPALVEKWQQRKWGEAAGFLDGQEAGKGKQEAIGQLIQTWADGDQQAASTWLAKQPAGPERDAGAAALAEEVRGTDPEAAAIWGATLGDAMQRRGSLRDTFEAWYRQSLPEALHWLESAPQLTESDRAAFWKPAPPNQ